MKDDERGLEGEILTEDQIAFVRQANQQIAKQDEPVKKKKYDLSKLTFDKVIIFMNNQRKKLLYLLFLAVLTLIICSGLILLSQEQSKPTPNNTVVTPEVTNASPSTNPKVADLNAQIDRFSSDVDGLTQNIKKLDLPKVNLDIKF